MIKWDRVGELRDEIGAEDFDEVVELFLDEVNSTIDLLENAAGDPVATEEHMHFLKGASLNLGFDALATLCLRGEKAAQSGDANAIPKGDVRACFEASKTAFINDLPKRFAA